MEPDKLIEAIKAKFPDEVVGEGSHVGQYWAVIKRDKVAEICRFLKEDPDTKMDYLIDITAVDYQPRTPRFEVVYIMHSMKHVHRVRLKVLLSEDDPVVPSVTGVWRTADWLERETYDLMGIKFDGHPDLCRILLPDDWEGHPLRKDYPIEGPEWKFVPLP